MAAAENDRSDGIRSYNHRRIRMPKHYEIL